MIRAPVCSSASSSASTLTEPAARKSAVPPPGTMPSSRAARVAWSASSTRCFFSFISVSVAAPTLTTATPPESLASRSCSFWAATSVPLWLLLAKLHGLYDRDERVLHHLTVDELPSIAAWAVTGVAGTVAVLTLSPAPIPRLSAIVIATAVAGLAGVLLRAAARSLWRATTPPEGAMIVGSDGLARATRRKVDLFPDMHVRLVRAVEDPSLERLHRLPNSYWA